MRKGFTLVELVVVIVLLGLLAVVIIPQYQSMKSQAYTGQENGVVGAVKAGIYTAWGAAGANWPAHLDPTPDGQVYPVTTGQLFRSVLETGHAVDAGEDDGQWERTAADAYTYHHPDGDISYTYTPATGVFTK